jgi:Ni,Fe-hydrogenase III component G
MIKTDLVKTLKTRMASIGASFSQDSDERFSIWVKAGDLRSAVSTLMEVAKPRFATLVALDKGLDIELTYLFSLGEAMAAIRTEVMKETDTIAAISDLVPAAEYIEKEVSEMFGLSFTGLSRQDRFYLPQDWPADEPPLRKPLASGLMPQARIMMENMLQSGSSLSLSSSSISRREKIGLPALDGFFVADEMSFKEYQSLIKRMGFDKKAGFDWDKAKLRYKGSRSMY